MALGSAHGFDYRLFAACVATGTTEPPSEYSVSTDPARFAAPADLRELEVLLAGDATSEVPGSFEGSGPVDSGSPHAPWNEDVRSPWHPADGRCGAALLAESAVRFDRLHERVARVSRLRDVAALEELVAVAHASLGYLATTHNPREIRTLLGLPSDRSRRPAAAATESGPGSTQLPGSELHPESARVPDSGRHPESAQSPDVAQGQESPQGPEPPQQSTSPFRAEVRAALKDGFDIALAQRLSMTTAQATSAAADSLLAYFGLPLMRHAVLVGESTWAKLRTTMKKARDLPLALVRRLDEYAVGRPHDLTPHRLGIILDRQAALLAGRDYLAKERARHRAVRIDRWRDGTARLTLTGPVTALDALYQRTRAMATAISLNHVDAFGLDRSRQAIVDARALHELMFDIITRATPTIDVTVVELDGPASNSTPTATTPTAGTSSSETSSAQESFADTSDAGAAAAETSTSGTSTSSTSVSGAAGFGATDSGTTGSGTTGSGTAGFGTTDSGATDSGTTGSDTSSAGRSRTGPAPTENSPADSSCGTPLSSHAPSNSHTADSPSPDDPPTNDSGHSPPTAERPRSHRHTASRTRRMKRLRGLSEIPDLGETENVYIDSITLTCPTHEEWLRRQAAVTVTVPVMSLLDEWTSVDESNLPAELTGTCPIPAETARDIVARVPHLERLLTDPVDGTVLPVAATKYHIPDALRRTTRARWRTCAAPGCDVSAQHCEIDHVVPFDHEDPESGGLTVIENLQPLCKHHHDMKTRGRLLAEAHVDRTVWRASGADTTVTRPLPDPVGTEHAAYVEAHDPWMWMDDCEWPE